MVLVIIAAVILAVAALVPRAAQHFYRIWMGLAAINSRILLSVMFYGVLTPYGVVSRLLGRDPLSRRCPPADSYWVPRAASKQTRDQFLRQF